LHTPCCTCSGPPLAPHRRPSLGVDLVWGVFCQGGSARVLSIFIIGCLVRSESPFPRPDPAERKRPVRAGAVKAGRLCGGHPRLGLDGFEHDGRLGRVGMTIGGEPACGARSNRAAALYSVGSMTPTMMQPCASAAKLRGGGPILVDGIEAMVDTGPRHLEPSSATRRKSCAHGGQPDPLLTSACSRLSRRINAKVPILLVWYLYGTCDVIIVNGGLE
jgi:hypothetical protein